MINSKICEQATGCIGAGDFEIWAKKQGYPYCEVLDRTSSAGDWGFIVSEDGDCWYLMWQTNNWPQLGFTRVIDRDIPYFGTTEEVFKIIKSETCNN